MQFSLRREGSSDTHYRSETGHHVNKASYKGYIEMLHLDEVLERQRQKVDDGCQSGRGN